jgi:hypothetical protein
VTNKGKLMLLAVPLAILVLGGIVTTAFLATNLVIGGLRSGEPSSVLLGGVLGTLWLAMLFRTARDRRELRAARR